MRLSPWVSEIGRSTFRNRRGADSFLTPASFRIRYTNGAALPSMIGTSGWFNSTMALSMPRAVSAASRCSTVSTDTASRVRPVWYWMPPQDA